ncbi:MAG TPA: circadian clock KaiB family protein [Terracidiphilus sp.]|nr:circadian clock KaiB family protein [Terracidiphilus sp.]
MKKRKRPGRKEPRWELRLYIADHTPRSLLAVGNLRKLCEEHLKTRYRITIVDIVREPDMARAHDILATPTLRVLYPKQTKVVGTLTDTGKVLQALGIPLESENAVAALEQSFTQIGHA